MENNFIIYKVEKYLDVDDLLSLMRVSKFINTHMSKIKEVVKNKTKKEIDKLYEVLHNKEVVELNTTSTNILNQVPLFNKIINEPLIYAPLMDYILNNCNHSDDENHKCEICSTILLSYKSHTKQINYPIQFSLMNIPESFITGIVMMLYH